MMKTLTKIGIVLVVLAMVTSVGFARTQEYIGPDGGTWCEDRHWDEEIPRSGKKDDVEVDNGNTVVIYPGCTPAEIDELKIIDGGVQVEGGAFLRCDGDLEMANGSSSDDAILNIVNGVVYVEDKSKKLARDGDIWITVAAGSLLVLDDGVYLGDSNDGTKSVYTFNIAGDLEINGDRLEHRGGQLIVNQTGGSFKVEKTSRLSMDDDSVATFNISGGTVKLDKIELNNNDDGVKSPFTYSLAIKVSGGSWDGSGEEVKDNDDGCIVNIDVTGGSFVTKDLNINDDDSEINITMSGGTFDIEDDIDMEAGDIVITGGVFNVEDDFELGDGKEAATMTVSGTADVWIDDLYMAKKSKLTINGVRMDLDDLKDTDDFDGSIEINGAGELVIKNADDPEDWDEIAALIEAGQITTSEEGMAVVWDYGISHEDKLTIKIVMPVTVDIKPGTCPNPLRVNFIGSGVYKVAIVGSADFDVLDVDVLTVTLQGVTPDRNKIKDISTFGAEVCGCTDLGPDGTPDLELTFDRASLVTALEESLGDLGLIPHKAELALTLDGLLHDDTPIQGSDCIEIRNRGALKVKIKD